MKLVEIGQRNIVLGFDPGENKNILTPAHCYQPCLRLDEIMLNKPTPTTAMFITTLLVSVVIKRI